ncbi:MAG: flagellar filament capping protein FliD [Burkholderiales bacterium]|nr:flagellar filament capping protein FliD [Burkholderiales bacterium]
MAIAAPGIGSGLDVNAIVEQLMALEQRPLLLLAQREASFQARLTGLGSIKGTLATFQSAAAALAALDSLSNRATASDTAALAASATDGAAAGTYSIAVTRLAQAQKLAATGQAAASAAIGAGGVTTVTLSFGTVSGGTFSNGTYTGATFTANTAVSPVGVTIDGANNTLEGIRDAINAAGAGVIASIVNDGSASPYRLALTVAETGAAMSLKVEVSGDAAIGALLAHDPAGVQNLVENQAARDAALTIDGIAVTHPDNTVEGAVEGVTLTLKGTTTTSATLTVAPDDGGVAAAAQAFVKAYNDLNRSIAAATGKGAQLQGDSGVLGLQQRLRAAAGAAYGEPFGDYRALSALGITFQLDGSLAYGGTKLAAALEADAAGALATLSGAGAAMEALAKGALGTGGVISAGTESLNASIESVNERRAALERRLEDVERRYRAQFSALDTLLASMNRTSVFLQQQLALLPTPDNSTGR